MSSGTCSTAGRWIGIGSGPKSKPAPFVSGNAARACIRYAFEEIRAARVLAAADTDDPASLRVMEKAGMEFEKKVVQGGLDIVFYSLTLDEYVPGGESYRLVSPILNQNGKPG